MKDNAEEMTRMEGMWMFNLDETNWRMRKVSSVT